MLEDIFTYVDDNFGFEEAERMLWYEPYQKQLPEKQVKLLQLWDELVGIPHDAPKQVFSFALLIIGFIVDPNAMTISMSDSSKADLVAAEAVSTFAVFRERRPLREYQQIAGWCNWAFNVYPLLRPGLSQLYHKIAGKSDPNAGIWSDGVRMLYSEDWSIADAEVILYCNACLNGLGFWVRFGDSQLGFQHCVEDKSSEIFHFEVLAVLSALSFAIDSLDPPPSRIVIYTDNTNTVNMFHKLKATPKYNPILLTAVNYLLRSHSQLRVIHIPGEDKTVTDALSRFQNEGQVLLVQGQGPAKRWTEPPGPGQGPKNFARTWPGLDIGKTAAIDPSSKSSYSSATESYYQFCQNHGFDIEPTPNTLSLYTTYVSHFIKPPSVSTYLSGICHDLEPFYPHVREARVHSLVRKTLKGCKKRHQYAAKRKRALERDEMLSVHQQMGDKLSHDDLLFLSIIFIGFLAVMCLGELVYPNTKKHQEFCKVTLRSLLVITETHLSFTLPTHKADQTFDGNLIQVDRHEDTVEAFDIFNRYIQSQDSKFPVHPNLWARVDGSVPTWSVYSSP
ncbi:hypothetical protein K435DRAFT_876172 [Dendrothele bispora CBS 962.96]|uniref:Uncharacterized protein n=1 Tax=Dendrothele bispora (strain CBS 962.96) TaxID=1314807 RepID=A0A4S8KSQ7_DENBC|nr:hypothetical protein K435DRAFT_876172 [Dendrothele bispora CBS 962.96]